MTDLSRYDDDCLFDTGDANRLRTIRGSLPKVLTRGSTIILDGEPQFKSPRTIRCPRCDRELWPGKAEIHFKHAAVDRRVQTVDALRCSCGEAYVSGDAARRAFQAAMGDDEAFDDGLRMLTTEELAALIEGDNLSQEQLRRIHEIASERLIQSRGLAERALSRMQEAGAAQ